MQILSLEDGILSSLHEDPSDLLPWQVLADHLAESNDQRADFARLQVLASGVETGDDYAEVQARVQKLLLSGIRPPVPTVTNSIGMELVLIPPGIFMMGSPEDEKGRSSDEGPQRLVCISKPFYMGKYPVTQKEWHAVMGDNPSHFRGDRLPVECVSWNDCQAFCKKLTEMDGAPYSLPTEAQWEYACRAGTTTVFAWGDSLSSHLANFDGNYPYGGAEKGPYLARTSEVGSYIPNAWGLYDMHGNVLEWCQDRYGPYEQPKNDGDDIVQRGGDWFHCGTHTRSAYRWINNSNLTASTSGLRVTRPVDESLIQDGNSSSVRHRGGAWSSYGRSCRLARRIRGMPGDRGVNLGVRITVDPIGKCDTSIYQSSRGQCWLSSGEACVSAKRGAIIPVVRYSTQGFRVVVDPIGKNGGIWQSLRGSSWLNMAKQSTSARRDKGCRVNQYEFRGFRVVA